MPQFVKVANLVDVPNRSSCCVEVNDRKIALFNLDGTIHAIDDLCPHAEASLSEGEIDGDEVLCPLHFATFEIRTGKCTGPPADEDVVSYPVRIVGEDIEIEI